MGSIWKAGLGLCLAACVVACNRPQPQAAAKVAIPPAQLAAMSAQGRPDVVHPARDHDRNGPPSTSAQPAEPAS